MGITGLLSEEGTVYATWDDEGDHIDKMTGKKAHHKKGDWKTDEFGNFYTEKVGNKEVIDKQFVTWSEVLTDDNSAWNKLDIFDSDNLETNIPKTVFKAAATVGALLLNPHIGATIAYTTAAINFARVLPQLTKTFASLFSENVEFDKLNSWDNYMHKFGKSTSDYAQNHFFGFENIMDMAVDSFMQLTQQRLIAQIPEKLGMMTKAKNLAESATNEASKKAIMQALISQDFTGAMGNREVIEALAKATPMYRRAEKLFNKARNVSDVISKAYLITTSTEDVYNQARSYGFDKQSASMISLATYVGIGTLFQTDYFRGILTNTPDYELQRDIRIQVKNYLKNNAKLMQGEVSQATTDEAKKSVFKTWGKRITDFFENHISEVESGRFGIVSGAISEGTEEVMEEISQDIAFQIGKGWTDLKSFFTGKEYTDNYDYSKTDPLLRYGSSFFGGALGGAIFKLSDRFIFDKSAYKNWREMMGNNSELSKEFVRYISQGKKDLIISEINKLEKAPFINGNFSAFDRNQVATNPNETQNSILFSTFRKAINDLDSFMTNNNLKIDYETFGNIELMRGMRAAWINSKGLQDSLFNDYLNRTDELSKLFAAIQDLRSQKTPNMESSAEEQLDKQIALIQQIIDDKTNEVRKLVNGEDDSYIGRLMLESNKNIMNLITPIDVNG